MGIAAQDVWKLIVPRVAEIFAGKTVEGLPHLICNPRYGKSFISIAFTDGTNLTITPGEWHQLYLEHHETIIWAEAERLSAPSRSETDPV